MRQKEDHDWSSLTSLEAPDLENVKIFVENKMAVRKKKKG